MAKSGDNITDVDDAETSIKHYVEQQVLLIDGSERRAECVAAVLRAAIFLVQSCDDHDACKVILNRVVQIITLIWRVQTRAALGFEEHDKWFWDTVVKQIERHTVSAIYGEAVNPPDKPGNQVVLQIKPCNRVEYFILRIPA